MAKLSPAQIEQLKRQSVDMNALLTNDDFFETINKDISQTVAEQCDPEEVKKAHEAFGLPLQAPAPRPTPQKITPRKEQTMNKRPVSVSPAPVSPISSEEENLEAELERLKAARVAKERALAEARQKEEEARQPAAAEPEEAQEEFKDTVLGLLTKIPGAPNPNQVEVLKKQFQAVYAIAFSETEVFLFTFLRRSQWNKIQEIMQEKSQALTPQQAERDLREKVVQNCIVWPNVKSAEFTASTPAGMIDTLFETIMIHSYFLTTPQAMQLTTKL